MVYKSVILRCNLAGNAALLERYCGIRREPRGAQSTSGGVRREQLGTCGRSVRAGQRSPNVTRRRATPTVHHHKSTAGPNGSAERLECTVLVDYGWAWPTRALSFAPVAPGTMLSSRRRAFDSCPDQVN